MKVVHLITTIERGGAENALVILSKAQKQIYEEVIVVPLKGKNDLLSTFIESGVKVDLTICNRPMLSQIYRLRRLYNEEYIFHAHLPRAELVLFASSIRKRSFLITRHNSEKFLANKHRVLSILLSRIITRSAKAVIVISKAVQEFLKKSCEFPTTQEFHLIYYGYQPQGAFLSRRQRKSVPSAIRLVSLSRLVSQKNIPLMLHLMFFLQNNGIEASLTIAGEGPLEKKLKALSAQLKLRNVSFVGKKKNPVYFLENYDFFILTSKYEGFGLALLEAMDAGLPIIASKTTSIPEVLGHNHPGLFDNNDLSSLTRVFLDLSNSIELQVKCLDLQYKQLGIYSVQSYLNKHDDLYRKIITNKS